MGSYNAFLDYSGDIIVFKKESTYSFIKNIIYNNMDKQSIFDKTELRIFPSYSYENNSIKIENNTLFENLLSDFFRNEVPSSLATSLVVVYKEGLLDILAQTTSYKPISIKEFKYLNKNIKFPEEHVFKLIWSIIDSKAHQLKSNLDYLSYVNIKREAKLATLSYNNINRINSHLLPSKINGIKRILAKIDNIKNAHIDFDNNRLLNINYGILYLIFSNLYKSYILPAHFKKIIHYLICTLHDSIIEELNSYIEQYKANKNSRVSYDDDYHGSHSYYNDSDYDDHTIREAFDGDPTLKWNID